MISVGIVEDDPHIRELVSAFLREDREFHLAVSAGSVEEFFQHAPFVRQMDVLLQDIGLPGMNGLDAIRLIKEKFPQADIVMFTVLDDAERIFKALCAGASGYLLKSTTLPRIKEGIVQVYRGEAAMTPSVAKKVIQYFQPQKNPEEGLTPKEQQIVQGLVDGLSYKMIADQLLISINTLNYHIKNIYRKLHVNSKAEVISRALKGGRR